MKILFFDGYCSLCNGLVDWGLKKNKAGKIHFASLQGRNAAKYLAGTTFSADIETVVYFRDGKIFDRSDAVLYFLKDIGGPYRLISVLFVIPVSWRNFIYKLVAKNRYVIFGKRDTCRIPTAEESQILLD